MARGVSDLQKWMLIRALENAESDICKTVHSPAIPGMAGIRGCRAESYDPQHITRSEIRAGYYKMVPIERVWYYEGAVEFDGKKWYAAGANPEDVHDPKFCRVVPGKAIAERQPVERTKWVDPSDREWIREHAHFVKNAAVNLAITRAHHRLIKRGLATDQVGFWLTDKGRDVARLLATPGYKSGSRTANNLMATPKDQMVHEGCQ